MAFYSAIKDELTLAGSQENLVTKLDLMLALLDDVGRGLKRSGEAEPLPANKMVATSKHCAMLQAQFKEEQMKTEDYRQILKAELSSRMCKNPGYSLRAFARDLDISNAYLSQLLSGKRSLAEASALKIAKALAWNSAKTDLFLKMVRLDRCKDDELKAILYRDINESNEFFDLSIEKFEIIANWLHFAILELTRLEGFRSDHRWMAKRLGVATHEVDLAVHRLLKLGLLKQVKGKLLMTKNTAITDVPSAALRAFHKSHLELAKVALEKQAQDRRNLSGATTAINPNQIPIALDMIKKFRRKLMKVLEEGEKTAVYHIAIQLYQLDAAET